MDSRINAGVELPNRSRGTSFPNSVKLEDYVTSGSESKDEKKDNQSHGRDSQEGIELVVTSQR